MILEISIKNNKICWEELVGKEHDELGYKVLCWQYDSELNKVKINEYHNEIAYTNDIVLADTERALIQIKNLGFEIILKETFFFLQDTIQKAQGLIQAGFSKLIKSENNYMVDNIFQQTFLLENELQYLLDNNILEINLSEIK
ncbi:hypothetical protein ACQ9ZF_05145 [Cetobacterium somerae]|uniref:hypothetical protein n=1 Tax=Cetobacterium somerae TaxID=188913 RepID=UPI003D7685A5